MTTSQIEALRDTINDALQVITNASKQIDQIEEPWTLPRQLPGFRALRNGEEWHRHDFTQDMLEGGWRPLLATENHKKMDEFFLNGEWAACQYGHTGAPAKSYADLYRTKRPLPILTTQQIAEGWIEWHGGENPVPGKECAVMLKDGRVCKEDHSHQWNWKPSTSIAAYRVIEPKIIPLGPDDVPPGSVIKYKLAQAPDKWWQALSSADSGITVIGSSGSMVCVMWDRLMKEFEINRSIPLTGKWDPTAWEPCHKQPAE